MIKIGRHTWHFIRMSKKSSSGSLLSWVIRWLITDWLLFCVRRSPGKLLKLALWSSSRRLCELARRSKNSSVLGDTVGTDGAMNRKKKSKTLPYVKRTYDIHIASSLPPCSAPANPRPAIMLVCSFLTGWGLLGWVWKGRMNPRVLQITYLEVIQTWLYFPLSDAHPKWNFTR